MCGASVEDDRHGGKRNHVIDRRWLAKKSLNGRKGRLKSYFPALAFQAFEQGRLFAADISTGAEPNIYMETLPATSDIRAQIILFFGKCHGTLESPESVRIFGAHIDITAGGSHGDSGNRHSFDQDERVALHNHAIGIGAAVTLI